MATEKTMNILEEIKGLTILELADLVKALDIGSIKELNNAAHKAKISTTMFGRETDVEVEYIQIRKIDAPLPPVSDDAE